MNNLLITRSTVRLMPQQIEARVAELIHDCLSQRSTAMADAIVQHVELLCAHPDYNGSWEERCAYRRLARRWRCLAWLAADQAR
ncbi:MAG: ATP dependent RNA helicase [Candidatus Competibacteraceae bacterium]|nr:ATP dependent RNA helicase [Candidatus Competibacteraceae bacterium]